MTHVVCLSIPLSEYFICETPKCNLLDFKLPPRANEIFVLLGFYAAWDGNELPTFR